MLVIMIFMAIMSTGSSEVVAIASILVYDIHMVYLKPFKKTYHWEMCSICGSRQKKSSSLIKCSCNSLAKCKFCKMDDRYSTIRVFCMPEPSWLVEICRERVVMPPESIHLNSPLLTVIHCIPLSMHIWQN